MCKSSDNSISFGMGLLVGVLSGIAAGVLLAPKPGEEMRKELKETTDKLLEKNNPEIDYIKSKYNKIFAQVAYSVEKQFDKLNTAIKANKMASAKKKEGIESEYNF